MEKMIKPSFQVMLLIVGMIDNEKQNEEQRIHDHKAD
jgi:hypothetical protein